MWNAFILPKTRYGDFELTRFGQIEMLLSIGAVADGDVPGPTAVLHLAVHLTDTRLALGVVHRGEVPQGDVYVLSRRCSDNVWTIRRADAALLRKETGQVACSFVDSHRLTAAAASTMALN